MPAHTHARSHPQASSGGVEIRLPWWSVALPALAFVVLLVLMADSGRAQAAAGDPVVGRVLEQIRLTLAG
ncbi:hypothetical protein ACIOJD_12415 [Streptomyces sp. NPDC088116]|uniref:hypothetical protein n=1 Tax=Streptomyces sp. NPDC088116 TaxID=3365825 RepID=UPI003819F21A